MAAYAMQLPELSAYLPPGSGLGGLSAGEGSLSSLGNMIVILASAILAKIFYAF